MGVRSLAGLAAALALALLAPAAEAQGARRPPGPLAVGVQRAVLANGLVVLLAPDPSVSSVAVSMTFRAGAQYAPAGRGGLAHLVEHLMATGPTPDTDYAAILERRGARSFEARTGFDAMSFDAVVPAEELPAALWAAWDRLVAIPPLVDAALVERHRRIVLQERAGRRVDAPYGLVSEYLQRRLYAQPSPLHGGVLGTPADLERATPQDVRAFVDTLLVPANAVLVVAGRFDPATARRLVEDGPGRLPAGRRAQAPPLPPLPTEQLREAMNERLGRGPRVTLAWRLQRLPPDDARALQLGAQLLSSLKDGGWGRRVSAELLEYSGESLFTLDVAAETDETPRSLEGAAESFLRTTLMKEPSRERLRAANLALDRSAMFQLDDLGERAALLARLEIVEAQATPAEWFERRRLLTARSLRDAAQTWLNRATIELHARPVRPRPPRPERP